jgi:prepilin-type N-terminal cleavage/methylation domain-containing protein
MSIDRSTRLIGGMSANEKSRRTERPGGFTLIELIAVLVIVGIMSAAVVPALNSYGSSRQVAASTQVLSDLHFARQRAVARGVRTWIVFDTDAETYSIFTESSESPGRDNRVAMTDEVTGGAYVIDLSTGPYAGSGITSAVIGDDVEVGFDYLGRSLDANEAILSTDGSVVLAGGFTITIAARTGHCYIAP